METLKENRNTNYNKGMVTSCNNFKHKTGLLTFKGLIGGRRKIVYGACAFLVATASIFYACKKDNSELLTGGDNRMLSTSTHGGDFILNEDYIDEVMELTGINLYELVECPFFLEYASQLDEFSSYFREQVRNDIAYRAEFDALLEEFIQVPLWEEEEELNPDDERYPEYLEMQHRYYMLAEQLSRMYFGDNFNHEVVFDGASYRIASDRINAMTSSRSFFIQNLESHFPQYAHLDNEWQKSIIRGGLMMLPYSDRTSCERRCDHQLLCDINEMFDVIDQYLLPCETKKCSKSTSKLILSWLIDVHDSYDNCINVCWQF